MYVFSRCPDANLTHCRVSSTQKAQKRESLRFDRMPGNGFRSIGGPTAAGYYRRVRDE